MDPRMRQVVGLGIGAREKVILGVRGRYIWCIQLTSASADPTHHPKPQLQRFTHLSKHSHVANSPLVTTNNEANNSLATHFFLNDWDFLSFFVRCTCVIICRPNRHDADVSPRWWWRRSYSNIAIISLSISYRKLSIFRYRSLTNTWVSVVDAKTTAAHWSDSTEDPRSSMQSYHATHRDICTTQVTGTRL